MIPRVLQSIILLPLEIHTPVKAILRFIFSCHNSNHLKADKGDECNGPKWIRQLAWDNITIDNHTVGGAYCVDTNNTRSPSVNQQTMHYINSMPDDDPATTIYVIFVGINDMVGHVRK